MIAAGTLARWLAGRPTEGSNGSSATARSAGERALGGVQRCPGRIHAVAEESQARLGQQQPRPRAGQPGGQRCQPPLQGRAFAAQEKRVGVPLDQPHRPDGVPGGQGVPHRVVGEAMILTPGGRGPVQARNPAGPFLLQAGAEQIGEQMVVPPPTAHLIQWHQEQAGLLHPLQHRLAVGAASDRITQPAGQAFQQRGFQQKGTQLLWLAVQHLLGQVVQDIAVAAAEGRHEPSGIGLPPQRKGSQLQAGHPAFGAGGQRRHRRGGQVSTSRFMEQGCRLFWAEAQVGGAQLGELPAGPQPRQRQRRVGPAGQHQVQSRRQVLEQEPQRDMDRLGVDQVVVVEDQQHLAVTALGVQFVDQRCHQPLERCRCRRAEQRADPLPDPRARLVQRGNHVPPHPHWVVVGRVQRQPGHRAVARQGPAGQHGRLARPSRGAHQDQPPCQPFAERLHQPRAGHEPRPRARHVQLGRQQGVRPGTGDPSRNCRRGLSDRRPTPSAQPATASLRRQANPL